MCHVSHSTVLSVKISCITLQDIGQTAGFVDLINTISAERMEKCFVLCHACGTVPDLVIVKIWSTGLEISWASYPFYFDSPQIFQHTLNRVLKLLIGMDS